MTVSPNSCRYCGIEERQHFQQWNSTAGWHKWTAPSQEQIKARMTARRSNTRPAA